MDGWWYVRNLGIAWTVEDLIISRPPTSRFHEIPVTSQCRIPTFDIHMSSGNCTAWKSAQFYPGSGRHDACLEAFIGLIISIGHITFAWALESHTLLQINFALSITMVVHIAWSIASSPALMKLEEWIILIYIVAHPERFSLEWICHSACH